MLESPAEFLSPHRERPDPEKVDCKPSARKRKRVKKSSPTQCACATDGYPLNEHGAKRRLANSVWENTMQICNSGTSPAGSHCEFPVVAVKPDQRSAGVIPLIFDCANTLGRLDSRIIIRRRQRDRSFSLYLSPEHFATDESLPRFGFTTTGTFNPERATPGTHCEKTGAAQNMANRCLIRRNSVRSLSAQSRNVNRFCLPGNHAGAE